MMNHIKDAPTINPIEVDNRVAVSKQPAAVNSIAKEQQPTNNVNFSSTSQQLDKLKKSLANLPEVDQKKVAEFKEALASNNYKIDSRKIAESMV